MMVKNESSRDSDLNFVLLLLKTRSERLHEEAEKMKEHEKGKIIDRKLFWMSIFH